MDERDYAKYMAEADPAPIVICNLDHRIVYLNAAARANYAPRNILGLSVLDCHTGQSVQKIFQIMDWFQKSRNNNCVYINHNERKNRDNYMIALRDEQGALVGYYEKMVYRNPETTPLYALD